MDAIILAGGAGTRLRSVVSDVPKPMAPIRGRPFLEVLLERLASQGVERVALSVGYRAEAIVSHFGGHWGGLSLSYAEEQEPLGTGGGIKLALESLSASAEGGVLVLNGDTFLACSLEALERFHSSTAADVTVALAKVADASRYGTVSLAEDGRVTGFAEKGATGSGVINAGVYVVSRNLFERFPMPAKFSFERDFLEARLGALRVYGQVCEGFFIDIGIPEDYERAQAEL